MNAIQRVLVSLLLAATEGPNAAGPMFKPAQRRIGGYGNASFDFSAILPSTNLRGAISVKRDLFARQEEVCAYPILCDGGTWCCPDGYQCVSYTTSTASLRSSRLHSAPRFRIAVLMTRIALQAWLANAAQRQLRHVEDGHALMPAPNGAVITFAHQGWCVMNLVVGRTAVSRMRLNATTPVSSDSLALDKDRWCSRNRLSCRIQHYHGKALLELCSSSEIIMTSQPETLTSEISTASSVTETESAIATSTGACSPTSGLNRRRIEIPELLQQNLLCTHERGNGSAGNQECGRTDR